MNVNYGSRISGSSQMTNLILIILRIMCTFTYSFFNAVMLGICHLLVKITGTLTANRGCFLNYVTRSFLTNGACSQCIFLYNEKYSLKSKRKLRYNIPVPKYKTIAQNKSKRCILKLSHCQISISGNSLKSIVALKNVSFSSTYNMILFYLLICCIFSVI